MLRRVGLGLLEGVVVGLLAGYGALQVLPDAMGGILGYVLAAVVGVLVGLVAGKPIWAKGAAVEAGLKAVIGALLGCALLFGLRYLALTVPALAGIPAAPVGRHPLASLIAVSTLLALFYEIDNSGDADVPDKHAPTRRRVEAGRPSNAAPSPQEAPLEEDEVPPPAKKRTGG